MASNIKTRYCIENEQQWNEIHSIFSPSLGTRELSVLGLDAEWVNGPICTLQLSTPDGICAVIRLSKMHSIPAKLKALLDNGNILKVGVGIDIDVKKLQDDYNLRVSSWLDLRYLAKENKNLEYLALHFGGIAMNKSSEIQSSNWDARVLSEDQKKYAAMDAYAASKIFEHFKNKSNMGSSYIQHIIRSQYADKEYK